MALLLQGCAGGPPRNIDNAWAFLSEKSGWYDATQRAQRRWGIPAHIQLAIVHQESRFKSAAQPPRSTLLGFIPWKRPSTAYGYSQAKDGTWQWYIDKTGNRGADRDDFSDATDFIGWYGDMTFRLLKIPKDDAFRQYLAYHEGHGGYKKQSYKTKSWLVAVAHKVSARATRYKKQLWSCADDLDGWWFWPF